jgi:hypothetical protein
VKVKLNFSRKKRDFISVNIEGCIDHIQSESKSDFTEENSSNIFGSFSIPVLVNDVHKENITL